MSSPPADGLFQPQQTIGAIEAGTFVSIFFFGILSLQTYNYFMTFPNDRIGLKSTVCWFT